MALNPGTKLGCYEILESLGSGGMGEVYLAHDPRLDRRVAIKLLPAHTAADVVARERLRREALAAASLDHPFVCKIFEVTEDDGALYVVMEYVRGETLFTRMRAGRLPALDGFRIACEIAEAIEEAHANRLVHRDLKPANIMLTAQGRVKVMDFGLAKRLLSGERYETIGSDQAQLTVPGTAVGTPDYMSPEQLTGGLLDERSDLFSFGILLCELLIGRHPFRRGSTLHTMNAILRDPPNLAPASTSQIQSGLMVLIRRLLAKSPDERYRSMSEARADLARLAAGSSAEPVQDAALPIPLIGRDDERVELQRRMEAALAGRGSLALIGGEPGIGKTHLTRAILNGAARRGCFTVVGNCYEMEGAPPYVPFIEMLEYGAWAFPPESLRYALGDAVPVSVQRISRVRGARRPVTPFVAVFEDLHWADESTLLLLEHLAQTISTMPALLTEALAMFESMGMPAYGRRTSERLASLSR